MQHAQKLEPLAGQRPTLAPLRVAVRGPSLWERGKTWAQRTLTAETVAEIVLGVFTLCLALWLCVSFSLALQNYTIVPLP